MPKKKKVKKTKVIKKVKLSKIKSKINPKLINRK